MSFANEHQIHLLRRRLQVKKDEFDLLVAEMYAKEQTHLAVVKRMQAEIDELKKALQEAKMQS